MDAKTGQALGFLTNQFALDALIVAKIYRRRWVIELFFRWIKQHLRLRGFYSTSVNGLRVQIWSAICANLLVAIAERRKNLPQSLWEILQIVSIASMEQIPLQELILIQGLKASIFRTSWESIAHNRTTVSSTAIFPAARSVCVVTP